MVNWIVRFLSSAATRLVELRLRVAYADEWGGLPGWNEYSPEAGALWNVGGGISAAERRKMSAPDKDVRSRYKNVRTGYIIDFDLSSRRREDGVDEKGV
jgi:hypothetical protein